MANRHLSRSIVLQSLFERDFRSADDNTIDEILDIPFGEERLIGGQDKDNKPILSESIKWIPGFGGVIRFLDVLSTDVQYETVQN